MGINVQQRFISEREAYKILLEETSKTINQMDMTLVRECLYYLYPENEEEDRAYIERTLPILHSKLEHGHRSKVARHGRARLAMVAVLTVLGILMLASVVAYAFGINVLNFFVYGTDEYWMIHVRTPDAIETEQVDSPVPLEDYAVWGDALVEDLAVLDMYPVLPKVIPEGYEYESSFHSGVEDFFEEYYYLFTHPDGRYLKLRVCPLEHTDMKVDGHIQKEEISQEIIDHNGIKVILAQNYDSVSATWISGDLRLGIIGTCTMDELKIMIGSM